MNWNDNLQLKPVLLIPAALLMLRGMTPAIATEHLHGSVARPLPVSLLTRQCTLDTVTSLRQILRRPPGASPVHLRLVSGDRTLTIALEAFRGAVQPGPRCQTPGIACIALGPLTRKPRTCSGSLLFAGTCSSRGRHQQFRIR